MTNPDRFNEDGTAKKKTKDLPPWKFSKACQRNKARVRELYRRKAEYTKCQHETLLNSMIKDSSIFINEPMDFKALAKKSRETKRRDKASVIKMLMEPKRPYININGRNVLESQSQTEVQVSSLQD